MKTWQGTWVEQQRFKGSAEREGANEMRVSRTFFVTALTDSFIPEGCEDLQLLLSLPSH